MRITTILLCICGMSQVAACGADHASVKDPIPAIEVTALPVAEPGQTDHALQLPEIPADRESSIALPLEQAGKLAAQRSLTTFEEGEFLRLKSFSEQAAWAIYSFDPGVNYIDNLDVDVDTPSDSSVFIAFADYSTRRWEIVGSYGKADSTQNLPVRREHLSPGGRFHCALITADGSETVVEKLTLTTTEGWQFMELGYHPYTADRSFDCAVIDGHPALAVASPAEGTLSYVRSSDPLGRQPQHWAGSEQLEVGTYAWMSLAQIGNEAAISVYNNDSMSLEFLRQYPDGSENAGLWSTPVEVSGGYMTVEAMSCLTDVDGHPALVYYTSEGYIKYARSASPLGTLAADWAEGIVLDNNALGTTYYPCLSYVAGHPAILFWYDDGSKLATLYMLSSTEHGSETGSWPLENRLNLTPGGYGLSPSLTIHEGQSLVSYIDRSSLNEFPVINYADNGNGTQSGDWSGNQAVSPQDISCLSTSVASVAGVPVVAYTEFAGGGVSRLWASFYDGNGGWVPLLVDPDTSASRLQYAKVMDVNGEPGIFYSTLVNPRIKYAIRSWPH